MFSMYFSQGYFLLDVMKFTTKLLLSCLMLWHLMTTLHWSLFSRCVLLHKVFEVSKNHLRLSSFQLLLFPVYLSIHQVKFMVALLSIPLNDNSVTSTVDCWQWGGQKSTNAFGKWGRWLDCYGTTMNLCLAPLNAPQNHPKPLKMAFGLTIKRWLFNIDFQYSKNEETFPSRMTMVSSSKELKWTLLLGLGGRARESLSLTILIKRN